MLAGSPTNTPLHATQHLRSKLILRRDVLSRHIQQHLVSLPKRTDVACDECQARKKRCDDGMPCENCWSNGYICIRTRHSRKPPRSQANNLSHSDLPIVRWGLYRSPLQARPTQLDYDISNMPAFDTNESYYRDIFISSSSASIPSPLSGCMTHVHRTNSSTTSCYSTRSTTIPTPETAFPVQVTKDSGNLYMSHIDSSFSVTSSDYSPLEQILRNRQYDMATLILLYFETIHILWPILYRPTFDPHTVPSILSASIGVIMTWFTNAEWHKTIARTTTRVFSQILAQSIVCSFL